MLSTSALAMTREISDLKIDNSYILPIDYHILTANNSVIHSPREDSIVEPMTTMAKVPTGLNLEWNTVINTVGKGPKNISELKYIDTVKENITIDDAY